MQNIELEKYLVYNEDFKILVFHSESKNNIIIPTLNLDNDIKQHNLFTEEILNYVENKIYFKTIIREVNKLQLVENNKLKKVPFKIIKKYFACYHEFTRKEELEIYKEAIINGLIPEFLTIDELLDNEFINISNENKNALYHLEKKLTYKMF